MRDAGATGGRRQWRARGALALCLLVVGMAAGQENPLGQVKTPAPVVKTPPPVADGATEAGGTKGPEGSGPGAATPPVNAPGSIVPGNSAPRLPRIRVDANLVLVPMTVTDPMNRLVTGLEAPNFEVFDNNIGQSIKSFSTEDAPVTIGIVFDLSGSMSSKFARARRALSAFLRTSNPQDEFFVVGFTSRQ
jgi:Ca-activated chloride channel family protein